MAAATRRASTTSRCSFSTQDISVDSYPKVSKSHNADGIDA